jgi:hypothetical protein
MAIMTMDDCDKKYALANTANIINNFINNFERTRLKSLIADDFHRQQISKYIKTWIIENIKYFNE